MEKAKLNAAIVGCGRIASLFDKDSKRTQISTHAGAYSRYSGTNLIAVCDLDKKRVIDCQNDWNVASSYTDYRLMMEDQNIDILSICTLNDSHEEILNVAVENDVKAIFCEKPISYSVASARRMIETCKKKEVILAVNHFRRWSNFFRNLKAQLSRGIIGNLEYVTFYYMRGIANSGSHLFDMILYLFGEIVSATAYKKIEDFGDDPTISALLKLKGNLFCNIVGVNGNNFRIFDMDIIGTKGRLVVSSTKEVSYLESKPSLRSSEFNELFPSNFGDFEVIENEHFISAVEDIHHSILTGDVPACSGDDGGRALEAIIGVRRAYLLEREVKFPLGDDLNENLFTK